MQKLLGEPVSTVVSLSKRLQKSATQAVDQLNLFILRLKREDEEVDEDQDHYKTLIQANPHLKNFDPGATNCCLAAAVWLLLSEVPL